MERKEKSLYSWVLVMVVVGQAVAMVMDLEQEHPKTGSSMLDHRQRTFLYHTSNYTVDQERIPLAARRSWLRPGC
jgi:hypothetical protein